MTRNVWFVTVAAAMHVAISVGAEQATAPEHAVVPEMPKQTIRVGTRVNRVIDMWLKGQVPQRMQREQCDRPAEGGGHDLHGRGHAGRGQGARLYQARGALVILGFQSSLPSLSGSLPCLAPPFC
jgi:hypothetical protein